MNLAKLEKYIGYSFKDPVLLQQAVTHRSFSAQHSERLEFLGDSILNCLIAKFLYHNFSDFDEGQLSRLRASLVSGDALSKLAKELQLGQFLRLGKGEEASGGRHRQSILEDVVEAIIGAIFLDSDWITCEGVVLGWFEPRLQDSNLFAVRNYKSALQEYLQAQNLELPEYQLIATHGHEHEQVFTVKCNIKAVKKSALGKGRSLKKAQQQAAEALFKQLTN